jgi:carbon storage regulator
MAMLVLTRRVGEEIVIDGGIVITVAGVKGGLVRLGITAPPSVCVDRREVHERRTQFALGETDLPAKPLVREPVGRVATPLNRGAPRRR